ncbi:MAG: PQQ-dependent sugar dehydrogenase [Labilithrix sp.]|nr:PQQ-dependent sugar dehydrogenase [Labilithrix sp.]MCW5813103.1 PQQ-dependent sugar dehydrogenase [Labilithrix sp.]
MSRVRLASLIALVALAGCSKKATGPGNQVPGQPVETKAANAPEQRAAFAGQTRAPFRGAGVAFDVRVVARGLHHPWSVAFLPDRRMLVTERRGRLLLIGTDGAKSEALAGVPKVMAEDQGGLLDVAVAPTFAEDGVVYLTFSEPREGGNGTALARAKLLLDGTPRLDGAQIVWRMTPTLESTKHFGARIVFAPDGNLFVTLGERSILEGRRQAQRLDSAFGKVVRLRPDGSAPPDNPFVGRAGALPEIWSIGHRNIQAAALHPQTKELWVVEHGARGGDEVNVARKGKDYGWPTIAYGIEYGGGKIGEGITQKEGMEQPVYYWDPIIAPSGAAFYDGAAFPAWRGSLFVGALAGKHLARLSLEGDRVVGEERLLVDRARVRDVRVGPSGTLFVLTDAEDGELLELVAK